MLSQNTSAILQTPQAGHCCHLDNFSQESISVERQPYVVHELEEPWNLCLNARV
jgi:hypothetical protein